MHSIDTHNTWNQDNAFIIYEWKCLSVILTDGCSEIRSFYAFFMNKYIDISLIKKINSSHI